jgi:UDP-4-amino-4,6-dideoxy-L-N-acetyl-beta-L-altrosamine transaminase
MSINVLNLLCGENMKEFIPYGRQFIDKDDIDAVIDTLKSDFITTGPKIEEFEHKICSYCGCSYSCVVSNGTAALHIASLAILNKNDRVLTTPNTFLSTVNSIIYAGAVPIFIDIDKEGNIDLDRCITLLDKEKSIKALYGVHFSGNMLNQEKLKYIKERYNITILEDCAHSLGAYDGHIKSASCRYSDVSILSFHPVKHITTGEGGAVTTNSQDILKKLIALRNSGIVKENFENNDMAYDKFGNSNPWYYEMQYPGLNYRITDFQAALGISQFLKLDKFLSARRKIAKRYDEAFKECETIKPLYNFKQNSAYHLYVIRIDFERLDITKAEFFNIAKDKNIGLQVHYIPVYAQPFYKKLGYSLHLENMEKYYKETASIPIHPSLNKDKQGYVIKTLIEIIKEHKR